MPTPAQVKYEMAMEIPFNALVKNKKDIEQAIIIAKIIKGFVKFFDNGISNVAVPSNTIALERYKVAINKILFLKG